MQKKPMFFVDFDGTIARQDVCYTMVKTFAGAGWEELNRMWEEGLLTTVECARRIFAIMPVTPGELEAFFDTMEIDGSFPGFAAWAAASNFPLYIVSDGYDRYIHKLLTRHGLQLQYYANRLVYERGWQIDCPYASSECDRCGVCKKEIIDKIRKPGYITIYIGDGYSDICPASNCDIVFARDTLARYCRDNRIPYYEFATFDEVRSRVTSWLEPSASRPG